MDKPSFQTAKILQFKNEPAATIRELLTQLIDPTAHHLPKQLQKLLTTEKKSVTQRAQHIATVT